ncbi:MAG: acyltransferase [Microbacteriaceae bacterium]|nr:acyltransferase [Microbacteriaceae bacterium]MCI1207634.1 acyltransferase [Microbacteriaceae bacterium]
MTTAPVFPAPGTGKAPHLYSVDVVRILTFACMIGVHVTSHTSSDTDLPLNTLLGLLHFTREVFFALSAFVLVLSYLYRPRPMRAFLPKRFLLVGVPYMVWSVIYFIALLIRYPTHMSVWGNIGYFFVVLVTGQAWYHLYFLLVTMQVYLLLPTILWLIRRTRGHHLLLLAGAAVFQLSLMAYYMYGRHIPHWIAGSEKVVFLSYVFVILLGAVTADHAASVFGWVTTHRGTIAWIVAGTGALTLGVFAIQHWVFGMSLYKSGTPLQPIIVIWGVAVALGFLGFGSWWAERRQEGSLSARTVAFASDISFGVYLVHPLVLWILLSVGPGSHDWVPELIPSPWLTIVTYAVVVAVSVGFVAVARRTPLSLPLAGRRRRRPVAPSPESSGQQV